AIPGSVDGGPGTGSGACQDRLRLIEEVAGDLGNRALPEEHRDGQPLEGLLDLVGAARRGRGQRRYLALDLVEELDRYGLGRQQVGFERRPHLALAGNAA